MTNAASIDYYDRGALANGFRTQCRVTGALLLREMHSRYGRDNIGYLWMVAEPMLLATVIGLMHSVTSRNEYTAGIPAIPLAVLGYTVFIMFRGIVNRAEGAMEAGASLLYHRMVTIEDVVLSRALLEAGGTATNIVVILSLMIAIGLAEPPARPLYLIAAVGYQFWISWAQSMLVVTISHDNRTLGRLVHVYTYFMIPLSGAFFQMAWLPRDYRDALLWLPVPHLFEMARYGMFEAATPEYFDVTYLTGWCMGLTLIGMLSMRSLRKHIHIS